MSLLAPPAPGTVDHDSELSRQPLAVQEAAKKLRELLAGYDIDGDLPLRPAGLAFRSPEDKKNFKDWCGLVHALPASEQQKLPSLLRLLGRAAWAFEGLALRDARPVPNGSPLGMRPPPAALARGGA